MRAGGHPRRGHALGRCADHFRQRRLEAITGIGWMKRVARTTAICKAAIGFMRDALAAGKATKVHPPNRSAPGFLAS